MSKKKSKAKSKSASQAKTGSAAQAKAADSVKQAEPKKGEGTKTGEGSGAKKRIAIIIGIVVAVIAAVAIGAFLFMNAGKSALLHPGGYDTSNLTVYEGAQSSDGGRTVTYNGATYKLNENVVPICVMGRDKVLHPPAEGTNGQADAVMVIAVDLESNDIKGIAIPRDTMVTSLKKFVDIYKDSSYKTDEMQLCLTYACGSNDDESSKLVASAVSKDVLFGIPVDFYYTLDTNGLGELANLADGVTLEALYTIPETYYESTLPINAGETVTLRGNDALRYVQYRDINRYQTALERLERQQQFVKALGKKLLERVKGNPGVAVDIFNTLGQYSTTNLGAAEFGYLASVAAKTNSDTVDMVRLQGEAVHNSDNPWEQFLLDEPSTYQTVLDTFYTKVD